MVFTVVEGFTIGVPPDAAETAPPGVQYGVVPLKGPPDVVVPAVST
jgi:hypothetical protein